MKGASVGGQGAGDRARGLHAAQEPEEAEPAEGGDAREGTEHRLGHRRGFIYINFCDLRLNFVLLKKKKSL